MIKCPVKEGQLVEINGVKMLIVKVYRNGDFKAISETDTDKTSHYSSVDGKNPEIKGNMDLSSLNLLKQVIGVV